MTGVAEETAEELRDSLKDWIPLSKRFMHEGPITTMEECHLSQREIKKLRRTVKKLEAKLLDASNVVKGYHIMWERQEHEMKRAISLPFGWRLIRPLRSATSCGKTEE